MTANKQLERKLQILDTAFSNKKYTGKQIMFTVGGLKLSAVAAWQNSPFHSQRGCQRKAELSSLAPCRTG